MTVVLRLAVAAAITALVVGGVGPALADLATGGDDDGEVQSVDLRKDDGAGDDDVEEEDDDDRDLDPDQPGAGEPTGGGDNTSRGEAVAVSPVPAESGGAAGGNGVAADSYGVRGYTDYDDAYGGDSYLGESED